MSSLPTTLAGLEASEVALAAMITGGIVIWIVIAHLTGLSKAKAKEETRREIAAYVAEGSITPEDGERLIRASSEDDLRQYVAESVAWGSINSKTADEIMRAGSRTPADKAPA